MDSDVSLCCRRTKHWDLVCLQRRLMYNVGHAGKRTWYVKRRSPQREWRTEYVNQMKWTIKTAVKRDILLFTSIAGTLISHCWSLLITNWLRANVPQSAEHPQFWDSLSVCLDICVTFTNKFVAIVCRSSPVRGSCVAGSRPCRLSEFTPNRASLEGENLRMG